MAISDLDANDKKVYEYLKLYDFVDNPWSTKKAAKVLKMKEDAEKAGIFLAFLSGYRSIDL